MPGIPLGILLLLVVVALTAPLLTSYHPTEHDLTSILQPPAWLDGGSMSHLLGTDTFGRDVLTRLIYGVRISLLVVVFSLAIGVSAGAGIGILAGYVGGAVDAILSRFIDIMLGLPKIIVALAVAVAIGPSLRNVVLILGFFVWPNVARLVRGEAFALRNLDFVRYSRTIGIPRWVILARHVLPNVLPTLLVTATLEVAAIILSEAGLSFLGAGVPPPQPSWGVMIDEGQALIATGWWIAVFPGMAIVVTVLCFNAVGDWLRDRLDPTTRYI